MPTARGAATRSTADCSMPSSSTARATSASTLAGRRPIGRVRGADVTWRHVRAAAGPGYFLTGDAAAVLDPAASHGVLRALMTGIAAGHAIAGVLAGRVTERDAAQHYCDWL